jgi:hypothetical protein
LRHSSLRQPWDSEENRNGLLVAFHVTHVAQNVHKRRRSAIDERTTRQPGYAISQRFRKRIEAVFGWMKTVGIFRKTRFRGFGANQLAAMVGAAYNGLRVGQLLAAPA